MATKAAQRAKTPDMWTRFFFIIACSLNKAWGEPRIRRSDGFAINKMREKTQLTFVIERPDAVSKIIMIVIE